MHVSRFHLCWSCICLLSPQEDGVSFSWEAQDIFSIVYSAGPLCLSLSSSRNFIPDGARVCLTLFDKHLILFLSNFITYIYILSTPLAFIFTAEGHVVILTLLWFCSSSSLVLLFCMCVCVCSIDDIICSSNWWCNIEPMLSVACPLQRCGSHCTRSKAVGLYWQLQRFRLENKGGKVYPQNWTFTNTIHTEASPDAVAL